MKVLAILMVVCSMFACEGPPDLWRLPTPDGAITERDHGMPDNNVAECKDGEKAKFLKYEVVVSPKDPTMVTASYELNCPARVYYLFTNYVPDGWELRGFTTDKVVKNHNDFTSFKPGAILYWRLEARNDSDVIVDSKQGAVVMP